MLLHTQASLYTYMPDTHTHLLLVAHWLSFDVRRRRRRGVVGGDNGSLLSL